jgi:hypothetical protein
LLPQLLPQRFLRRPNRGCRTAICLFETKKTKWRLQVA